MRAHALHSTLAALGSQLEATDQLAERGVRAHGKGAVMPVNWLMEEYEAQLQERIAKRENQTSEHVLFDDTEYLKKAVHTSVQKTVHIRLLT
jgi:hypothetical protein